MFDDTERAVLDTYLRADSRPCPLWCAYVVAGALVCAAGVAFPMLQPEAISTAAAVLVLVCGMIVIATGLDARKRSILARIIQEYDRALRAFEAADEKDARLEDSDA
ncbi:MAG: hypothetical protein QGI33_02445 [Candidatus Brocadiia bacterium]|jgi:sulfite exporter TauE/SafE|nr:hypothetical protein [Candidatus Brocadiia bacterium]